MKALLIDPGTQTISVIEIEKGLQPMYKVLECQMVEAPIEFDNGDTLWCDEEGKFQGENVIGGFRYDGWNDIIVGKCLVTGTTKDGNTTDCKSTVGYIKSLWNGIIWYNQKQASDILYAMGY